MLGELPNIHSKEVEETEFDFQGRVYIVFLLLPQTLYICSTNFEQILENK